MTDHDELELDQRLRAANRVPAGIAHTEGSHAWLEEVRLQARNCGRDPVRRAGWRLPVARRGVALAPLLGILAVGGAAAATILTTYTGRHSTGWQVQAAGRGQFLRVGAPGYCQAVSSLTADIPYPSGYSDWRTWALVSDVGVKGMTEKKLCDTTDAQQSADSGAGHVEVTTGAEQALFVESAFCAWTDSWLNAKTSGNSADASRAANVIAGALRWPAAVAADPHPSDSVPADSVPIPGQSGSSTTNTTTTLLGWLIPFQQAVQSGRVAQVQQMIASNAYGGRCTTLKPPADSADGTYAPFA